MKSQALAGERMVYEFTQYGNENVNMSDGDAYAVFSSNAGRSWLVIPNHFDDEEVNTISNSYKTLINDHAKKMDLTRVYRNLIIELFENLNGYYRAFHFAEEDSTDADVLFSGEIIHYKGGLFSSDDLYVLVNFSPEYMSEDQFSDFATSLHSLGFENITKAEK